MPHENIDLDMFNFTIDFLTEKNIRNMRFQTTVNPKENVFIICTIGKEIHI